jgi:hypothetical protein
MMAVEMAAVFTVRVVDFGRMLGRQTVAWSAEVRYVLFDDTESLVHHGAILAIPRMSNRLTDTPLDIRY